MMSKEVTDFVLLSANDISLHLHCKLFLSERSLNAIKHGFSLRRNTKELNTRCDREARGYNGQLILYLL